MWYISEVCSIAIAVLVFLGTTHPPNVSTSLIPVPGSSTIYQGVLYNLQAEDGSFLDLVPSDWEGGSLIGLFPRPVFFHFRQELASGTSANFVFIPRGGDHPGLAGMTITEKAQVFHFLGKDDTNSTMVGNSGTVFKPELFCYSSIGFYFFGCSKYSRFSLKQVELGKDPLYLLAFSDDNNLENRKYMGKQPHPNDTNNTGDEKRYIPSITEDEEKAVRFKIVPVVDQVAYSIVRFNSDEDITDKANDVKMATDEVILNKANVVLDHVYSKKLIFTSTLKLQESWRLKVETSVKLEAEASVGFAEIFSAKAKTSVEAKVSFEGGKSSETTCSSVEEFELVQTVTVQPFKAVRCSSWVKVVQGTAMPYRAEAIVRMYFKELDPVSGEIVSKAMPPQLVLGLIPYYIHGWTILKATSTGVLVEMSGSMTAHFGVSAFFTSENLNDSDMLKKYEEERPKGMFRSIDKNPKIDL